jgi:hypothetical protein
VQFILRRLSGISPILAEVGGRNYVIRITLRHITETPVAFELILSLVGASDAGFGHCNDSEVQASIEGVFIGSGVSLRIVSTVNCCECDNQRKS